MAKEILRKVNNFVGDRTQLACSTIIDITNAVSDSFEPVKKHRPDIVVRFVQGQKDLFGKRRDVRNKLIG
jgi:hypothetical protein